MSQDFGTLGRLVVSLEANMASFEAGLNKAEYQMQQFSSRIDTLTAGASKALLGLAATAAAAFSFDAIVGGVEKAISAAAELEKMSQKAGISAEALSGLKSVGKLTGASLEEIVGSLQKLDKAMIQAESGSQKQAATFKTLGVSMADLKNLTPDEVMLKVAKSLDQVESGSVRVAAAQILFGRAGANLLPMLHDLAQQGEIVGKVTDDMAAMADKYERSLIALDGRKKALYNTIASALLPTMIDFVDAFSKADSIVGRLNTTAKGLSADNSLRDWARGAAMGAAYLFDVFDGLARVFQIAGSGLARFMADMKAMLDFGSGIATVALKEGPSAVAARWAELQGKLASNRQVAGDNADNIINKPFFSEKLQAEFDARDAGKKVITPLPRTKKLDLGGAIGSGASAFENFLLELDRQATKLEQGLIPELTLKAQQLAGKEGKDPSRATAGIAAVQTAEETRFVNDYTRAMQKQTEAESFRIQLVGLSAHEQELLNIQHKADIDLQQKLAEETKKLGPLTEDTQSRMTKATQDATDKMIASANARYDAERKWSTGAKIAIDSYLDTVTNAAAQMGNLVTKAFKGMEDALVNFTMTGKLDFKSLANSIISDMVRMQIQANITKPLAAMGGDFLKGLFSGDSGLPGNATTGIQGLNYPGFATGTDYVPHDMLAYIHQGEAIIPAAQNTGGGQGGVTISQVINIDSRSDRSSILSAMNQAKAEAVAAVEASIRRGGALAKAARAA